ncbi:MAG: 30S ribosomal protein S19 [Methanosarcinales archaeon]
MAKKSSKKLPRRKGEFTYRGYTIGELKNMKMEQLVEIMPARPRRTIKRDFSDRHKKILKKIQNGEKVIRTHLRDMIILPNMVGLTLEIYNGKEFNKVEVQPEMIGHYFGEFALTRKKVVHGSAGIGATRSSKFIPLK